MIIKKFNEDWDSFSDYLNANEAPGDDDWEKKAIELGELPPKKVEFDTKSVAVVGLPSGQIIYMNNKQINYFKARNLIGWKNVWKKPQSGGFTPITIGEFTFEDKQYKTIIDLLDTIVW